MNTQHFIRAGEEPKAPRLYRECGLDEVYLCNGYRVEWDGDTEFVFVEDRKGLHNAIALHLVTNRKVLSGKEVRFIRNAMDLTQRQLADHLGTTSQSLARWEKDQVEVPGAADRLLRITFVVALLEPEEFQQLVRNLPSTLDEMNEVRNAPVHFSHGERWAEAA
jgi:DNA-binding transcriptional regulator YiaG